MTPIFTLTTIFTEMHFLGKRGIDLLIDTYHVTEQAAADHHPQQG
jgi:hypothetical protein